MHPDRDVRPEHERADVREGGRRQGPQRSRSAGLGGRRGRRLVGEPDRRPRPVLPHPAPGQRAPHPGHRLRLPPPAGTAPHVRVHHPRRPDRRQVAHPHPPATRKITVGVRDQDGRPLEGTGIWGDSGHDGPLTAGTHQLSAGLPAFTATQRVAGTTDRTGTATLFAWPTTIPTLHAGYTQPDGITRNHTWTDIVVGSADVALGAS